MHGASRGQGLSRTVFVLLLVAFSWPVLSIPQAGGALLWLFAAWGAGIALLLACARLTLRHDPDDDAAPPSAASSPEPDMAPVDMTTADTPTDNNAGGPGDD